MKGGEVGREVLEGRSSVLKPPQYLQLAAGLLWGHGTQQAHFSPVPVS